MSLARKIYLIALAAAFVIAAYGTGIAGSVDCGAMTFEAALLPLGIAASAIVICIIIMEICEGIDEHENN